MGGRNDGGALAFWLIFCSLDVLQRSCGPFGGLIGGAVACVLLIGAIIWLAVWAANSDQEGVGPPPPLPPGAVYSSPPPPPTGGYLHPFAGQSAKGERHSPESTTEQWWFNFALIFFLLTVLTTPACYYMPSWGTRTQRIVYVQTPPAAPPLAPNRLPVVRGELVPDVPDGKPVASRPLLALRTDCMSTDHV